MDIKGGKFVGVKEPREVFAHTNQINDIIYIKEHKQVRYLFIEDCYSIF